MIEVNLAWHCDLTWMPVPSKYGLLYSEAFQSGTGELQGRTEYADMRAGYDALDEATKKKIENLNSYHSMQYPQGRRLGNFPTTGPGMQGHAYLRPLVWEAA